MEKGTDSPAISADEFRLKLFSSLHHLQDDPEDYTAVLTTRARQAYTQGLIDDEDLRELLEWADAAREWGVEATSYR